MWEKYHKNFRKLSSEKKSKLTISINPYLRSRVEKLATKKHRSISNMIEMLLIQALELPEFMGGVEK